jgi:hypothetical protein
MKLTLSFILILGVIFSLKAQDKPKYQISVVVLLPDETILDSKTQVFFDSLYLVYKNNINSFDDDFKNTSPNLQLISKKFKEMSPLIKITDEISFQTAYEFSDGFEKGTDSFVIYPINQKTTTDLLQVEKIALQEQVNYIIGISQITYSKVKDDFKITAATFLYDAQKNEIFFQKSHESTSSQLKGNETNFSKIFYSERSLIYQFGQEMFNWITENSPDYKSPEKVWQARRNYIFNTLYHQEPNPEILEILFSKKQQVFDKSINIDLKVDFKSNLKKDTSIYFQGFFNEDKTKFLAFIVNKKEVQRGQSFFGGASDTIPKSVPATKINVWMFKTILGVLYQNEWFVEFTGFSSGKNDFEENVDLEMAKKEYLMNLTQWDYFKPFSADLNPELWDWAMIQTDFSEEIASAKKLLTSKNTYIQQKRINQEIKDYQNQAKENEIYKGLPRLVVESLQKEKSEYWDKIFSDIVDTICVKRWIINDFEVDYKESKDKSLSNIKELIKTYQNIQPMQKPYCLAPFIAIDNKGNQTLRFFLFHKTAQKIYDWTYFKPILLEKKYDRKKDYFDHEEYIEELIDKKMIEWFGSIEEEDISKETFWQEYVFKQRKGRYEFLKPVADFPSNN